MIKKERSVYMDLLRVLACFLVIFNHLPGYFAYQKSTSPGLTFYYMFFTMVSKVNVPIFFMLTGALLLPRTTTYKELFSKRILRIACVLIISSLTYYIVRNKHDFSAISVFDFVKKIFIDDLAGAFWYMYAYLGLLLTLPFMQRIAQRFTTADFILLLSLRFITSSLIPLANHVLWYLDLPSFWYTTSFSIPFVTTQCFFYPLIGYYLEHVFDIQKLAKKHLICLTMLSCLGILIASCLTYHEGIVSGFTQNYVATFNYLFAINVFLLVKYIFTKYEALNSNSVLPFLSSLTFGIYWMEPIFRCLDKDKYFDLIFPTSYPILHTVIWCLFSMSVCGFVTYLMKKVPILRNLV